MFGILGEFIRSCDRFPTVSTRYRVHMYLQGKLMKDIVNSFVIDLTMK